MSYRCFVVSFFYGLNLLKVDSISFCPEFVTSMLRLFCFFRKQIFSNKKKLLLLL